MSDVPTNTHAEYAADAAIHGIGLAAVLAGCVSLALVTPWALWPGAAIGLYALGLVATFTCSAAYNLAPAGRGKALLRRFDHAAIFLMIAGTYTPVSLLAIGGTWGAVLLAIVWGGALPGAAVKLLAPGRYERASIAAYLLLGWVGVAALAPLIQSMEAWQLGMLILGGALYSLGVFFHLSPGLPYNTAIWHGFVVTAAACHFAVVFPLARG
ncbi:hemolysin III family protein [Roseomonas sp. SSH11]|uniref:Hemolysin III family protein n=1 Tax=Pararoseomonas baculiformis TaxID=2820812 RepID=A0ABS4ACK0_9PROT|nr:hemolysin III family protein [Pararoseomonas baculiformis]MBP0444742.1 hemolysin III family protein [Pararoseomonas baculiformis]